MTAHRDDGSGVENDNGAIKRSTVEVVDQHDADAVAKFKKHLSEMLEGPDFWNEFGRKNDGKTTTLEDAKRVAAESLSDEPNLHRILIARKHNMGDASNLFFEQVAWRSKWKPREVDKGAIPHALASGAWRLCGYSNEGCVVSNYKLKYWKPSEYGQDNAPKTSLSSYLPGSGFFTSATNNHEPKRDEAVDEYVRYVAYMCELMIGRMHADAPRQFLVLFDLEGFSSDMVLSRRSRLMISRLIYVAQSQYPERLRKVYLVNVPYGFSTAWKLIKSVLDVKTASKVKFVSGDLVDALKEDVDVDTLSVAYGGRHAEYDAPSLSLKDEISSGCVA